MKKSESDSLVMLLTAAFPHTKATKETCAVYSELLQDLDFEVAKKAVTILISSEQFLPTVASIREQYVTLQIGPRKTGVEAWAEAGQTCRKFGPHKKPNWSDQLIPEALQVFGGYVAFCNSPADDAAGRARFIELYDVLSKRARDEQRTGVTLPAPGGQLPSASVFGLMGQGKAPVVVRGKCECMAANNGHHPRCYWFNIRGPIHHRDPDGTFWTETDPLRG